MYWTLSPGPAGDQRAEVGADVGEKNKRNRRGGENRWIVEGHGIFGWFLVLISLRFWFWRGSILLMIYCVF